MCINQYLSTSLNSNPDAASFFKELSNFGDPIFFGGCIRDFFLFPETPPNPRDFDIVMKSFNGVSFHEFIQSYNYQKNRFGGYKVTVGDTEFDIWDMTSTWAFKNNLVSCKEENLPESVFLNLDGIAYNFKTDVLHDNTFRSAMVSSEIDIVLTNNPQIELNLLRTFVFLEKYKFSHPLKASTNLKNFFHKFLKENPSISPSSLYDLQTKHYRKEVLSLFQITLNFEKIIQR